MKKAIRKILITALAVCVMLCASLTLLCGKLVSNNVPQFFSTCIVSAIVSGTLIFFIGMKTNERKAIVEKIMVGRK